MKKTLAVLAVSMSLFCASAADTMTFGPDASGVTWTAEIVSGTNVKLTGASGNNTVAFDAANFPWTFKGDDDTIYTVTQVADGAFYGWSKLTGVLSMPDTLNTLPDGGSGCFQNTGITGVYFGKNLSQIGKFSFKASSLTFAVVPEGFKGSIRQQCIYNCPQVVAVWAKGGFPNHNTLFYNCPKLETVLFGKNTSTTVTTLFQNAPSGSRKTMFIPANDGWKNFSQTHSLLTVIRYGAEEDLDIDINETTMTLTATAKTAAVLKSVLESAPNFKTYFGLDTKIRIASAIDYANSGITADLVNSAGVSFDSLMFAVNTQAELNDILETFPGMAPIAIDPSKAAGNLEIASEERDVYVKLPKKGEYRLRKTGTVIVLGNQ